MDESGRLKNCIEYYLEKRGGRKTFEHCVAVGDYASQIGVDILKRGDRDKVKIAGYLHDISAIYPNNQRIAIGEQFGVEILEEEREFPLIIHQKLSKKMAQNLFNIHDCEILSAIECHTTLKRGYSQIDLVLFVADKIKWDQVGTPPYLDNLVKELSVSFERAAFYYIDFILDNGIKIPHPWLMGAYSELKSKIMVL